MPDLPQGTAQRTPAASTAFTAQRGRHGLPVDLQTDQRQLNLRSLNSAHTVPRGLRARFDRVVVGAAIRVGVSPRAVLGFVVLAALIVATLGVRLAIVQHRSIPVPLSSVTSSAVTPPPGSPLATSVGSPLTASGSPTAGATPGKLHVHVVGQVRRPGVVHLSPPARVADAVHAAGGATSRADLGAINLARLLIDGEQVRVPRPGEEGLPAIASGIAPPAATSGSVPGAPSAGVTVDLNTATTEQLDALSGIGPVLAERIVAWRTEHGRFTSVDELGEVSGIGDAILSRIRSQVRV
ncbi:MAG: helix-hairpin-helix domain-containing protein [Actinomycetota bacterium]